MRMRIQIREAAMTIHLADLISVPFCYHLSNPPSLGVHRSRSSVTASDGMGGIISPPPASPLGAEEQNLLV